MRLVLPGLLVLLGSIGAAGRVPAETGVPPDAIGWLGKLATASRQHNYAGTFVYQHGGKLETSRIVHWVDASGESERLETLDGPMREIVRNNDNVIRYLPDLKTVLIEKRARRRFPTALPEQLSNIPDNYVVRKGEHDRVAGLECQVIALESRDNLRYGREFCAELVTGLPLRARTFDEKNELVDSFAFTEVAIGNAVSKKMLKSRYASKSKTWRVYRPALEQIETNADTGWVLKNRPAGFKKLTEIRRSIAGRSTQVSHIVYSDGLAAVSIFIEPMPKPPPLAGPTYQGAVNIYVKPQAGQIVTVVGETPARTVKQIAESLSSRGH